MDRVEDVTKVTVYSNQPEVELLVNGQSLGRQRAEDHFFRFEVPNRGESRLRAVAGACTDESTIRKVDTFNESYRLKEKGAVLNWFDVTAPEGYFSLNDKVGDVMANPEGAALFSQLMKQMMTAPDGKGLEMTPVMLEMMNGFTVLRLTSMMSALKITFTKEQLLELNERLNQIVK